MPDPVAVMPSGYTPRLCASARAGIPTLQRHATSVAARAEPRITASPLLRGDVLPEAFEALVASEQRREDRRVGQQDVAGPFALRRHPQEHVELAVSCLREWMRPRGINRLLRQQVNGARFGRGDRVVGQMRVKVERLNPFEPAPRVKVVALMQRLQLPRARDGGRAQAVLIVNGYAQALHQRPRVLAETLLPRNQRVAVVRVFHSPFLEILRHADVVVRADDQTSAFALEPLADGI